MRLRVRARAGARLHAADEVADGPHAQLLQRGAVAGAAEQGVVQACARDPALKRLPSMEHSVMRSPAPSLRP